MSECVSVCVLQTDCKRQTNNICFQVGRDSIFYRKQSMYLSAPLGELFPTMPLSKLGGGIL